MTAIRTIAAGLAFAAFLIVHYASDFMRLAMTSSEFYVAQTALQVLYPKLTDAVSAQILLPTAFVLGCVAAGLFAASMVVPFIERLIYDTLEGCALVVQMAAKGVLVVGKRMLSRFTRAAA